jgi:hypothetical protein
MAHPMREKVSFFFLKISAFSASLRSIFEGARQL